MEKERESLKENDTRTPVNCDAIIIVGLSGSGKSTLMRRLEQVLDVTAVSTSSVIRSHEKKRKGEKGHILGERTGLLPVDDIAPDRLSRMYIQKAKSSGQPIVLDAKRGALEAAWLTQELGREGKEPPKIFTIFLDYANRFERVVEREKEKNPNFAKTVDEVKIDTLEREAADFTRWQEIDKLYPGDFYGVNPYNPKAFKHDLFVENEELDESIEKIIEGLTTKGFIDPSQDSKK